jgi:carbamoyl-phosphate synthase large subunit
MSGRGPAVRILITGAGSVMGQSIYRALAQHELGTPVEIHFANSDELGAGRYFTSPAAPVVERPRLPLAVDYRYLQRLASYVEKHEIDIVFPGTQHELLKIAQFRDETGKAATLNHELARFTSDKYKLTEYLRDKGVAVPETQRLSDFIASPAITGPVVVKPNSSSSSRSVFRIPAGDPPQLDQVIREIGEGSPLLRDIGQDPLDGFIVQSELSGDEFTCGCYLDKYSKTISVIVLRRSLTADGATGYGEVVADAAIEDYVRKVAVALIERGFDYGHINVQLIATSDGPVLFEVNGRLSSTEAPKAKLGFNSCVAFVENVVFGRSSTLGPVETGRRFLRFYDEVYF